MLPIRSPGLERLADQVGLAEHAVQVHVEARQPVARTEAEAGGEHAGVAFRVDRDEVGRVARGVRPVERLRQRDRTLSGRQPAKHG